MIDNHCWMWDNDGEMIICGRCDTYRGSRASLKSCPAVDSPIVVETMEEWINR